MAQQTAVEWLVKMLYSPVCKGFIEGRTPIPFHIIEQAKAMEKEQMDNTWNDSRLFDKGGDYIGKQKSFEQYYNETYKKQ